TAVPSHIGPGRGMGWTMVMVAALLAAVLTAGGFIAYRYLAGADAGGASDARGERVEASATERPPWLTSDLGASAYCTTGADLRMSCVGVSMLEASQSAARSEGEDAALEAIVQALIPRIDDPAWTANVTPLFTETRRVRLSMLGQARRDPNSLEYDRTLRAVRDGRAAVARALRTTGGALIPSDPSGVYWERYRSGQGDRYQVAVEYQLSGEVVGQLLERYSRAAQVAGSRAVTAFPAIAWRYPDIERGAVITALGAGIFKDMGVAERYIVLSLQDRVITDSDALARIAGDELAELRASGGQLRLVVKTGDNRPMEFNRPVPKGGAVSDDSGSDDGDGDGSSGRTGTSDRGDDPRDGRERLPGPVNTWDRVDGE
ncbi:MAG: hypothetical protein AAGC55_15560, partial [Myxococcota bacterium]